MKTFKKVNPNDLSIEDPVYNKLILYTKKIKKFHHDKNKKYILTNSELNRYNCSPIIKFIYKINRCMNK